jgi:ABC-type uncharacterized transport system substrate-binding protein
MRKESIVFALCAMLFALCVSAEAQQPKKAHRIGFLLPGSPTSPAVRNNLEAFRQGLRDLDYVEGQNITIEYRYAEGKSDRLPGLASELVRLKADLIVVASTPAALAAKNATKEIPVVFETIGDPIATGVVASFARPGGNITG